MILKKVSLACMVLAGGLLLTACGGGGSTPVATTPVAATNLSANATATVVSAIGTTPVVFANGFSGVDTAGAPVSVTGATTVAFSGTGATPNVSITNGGFTASGVTTFGSCIFTFTTSTFPSGHPFSAGRVTRVDPCTLTINTANMTANGFPALKAAQFAFGNFVSNSFNQSVTVNSNGSVTSGNITLGSTTITNVTGGGS